MKIVEVISDTNIGGAGILLANRLECTDLEKYPTCVFLPAGSKLLPRLEGLGVDCREIDCVGDRSWAVQDVRKYKKALEREKPCLVNCHGALSARVAAKALKIPVKICTRHCVFPTGRFMRASGILNSRLSDIFIAVADSAKQNLLELGVDESKIHVIINGAKPLRYVSVGEKKELKERLGIRDETCILVMCARLEKCKGHRYLLESMRLLKNEGVSCIALLLGDGSEREALEKLCFELGVRDRVIFLGFTEDVAPYMSIAHINVNCSVGTETSSLALSEGMSLGIPAIVSDYGGNPYMVRDGVNGLIYKAGDAVGLSECIKRMIKNGDIYQKMCEAAFERFGQELNSKAMTKKTNRLYDRLLKESHRTEL